MQNAFKLFLRVDAYEYMKISLGVTLADTNFLLEFTLLTLSDEKDECHHLKLKSIRHRHRLRSICSGCCERFPSGRSLIVMWTCRLRVDDRWLVNDICTHHRAYASTW